MAALGNSNRLFILISVLVLRGVELGKATMLSFGVAQSICTQQSRFLSSGGVLGGPLNAPLSNRHYDDCDWIKWNTHCRGKDGKSCPLFEGNNCVQLQAQARIVGGTEIVPYSYPSFVRIILRLFGDMENNNCGGTIINKNWVLTARHCINDLLRPEFFILAGRQYYNVTQQDEQLIKVDRWIKHPYQPRQDGTLGRVDMALMHLQRPLEFNDKIQPVSLPTSNFLADEEEPHVTVVGNGAKEGNQSSNEIREATIPAITPEKCRKVDDPRATILDWEFCLHSKEETSVICFGDSGGPGYLIRKDETTKKKTQIIVGVISWLTGKCVKPPRISGLSQIFPRLEWIRENTK